MAAWSFLSVGRPHRAAARRDDVGCGICLALSVSQWQGRGAGFEWSDDCQAAEA